MVEQHRRQVLTPHEGMRRQLHTSTTDKTLNCTTQQNPKPTTSYLQHLQQTGTQPAKQPNLHQEARGGGGMGNKKRNTGLVI